MRHWGVVVAVAAVLGAFALWESLGVLHDALAVARSGAHSTRTERLLLPAHVVGVADTSIYPRLAALMPAHATYGLQQQSDAPPAELAGGEGAAFAVYWLMPRRQVPLTAPQDYTIVFGSVPRGQRAVKTYPIAAGVTLLKDR